MKHSRFKKRGLTLLEVILAMGIVAMVILGVQGLYAYGLHCRRVADEEGSRAQSARGALSALAADLRAASGVGVFSGSSGQMGFASCPGRPGPAGLRYVGFSVSGNELIRREWPRGAGSENSETLIDNVARFELQFFDGHSWSESWTGRQGRLPRAVRIRLDLGKTSHETEAESDEENVFILWVTIPTATEAAEEETNEEESI